jgi:acetyl esterase/lipase
MRRILVWIACGAAICGGCGARVPSEAALGPVTQPAPGVTCQEAKFDETHRLWVYKPATPPKGKLPCVIVAPAGSKLIHGMALVEDDRAEHIPYAQAGFVVVAYDLSGPITNDKDEQAIRQAVQAYVAADAGVEDGKRALEYVLKHMPEVDPKKIATAGHSSAANQALMLAENEPRIAACVAYAPALSFINEIQDSGALATLDAEVPGLERCLRRNWPVDRMNDFNCPTFVFRALDDPGPGPNLPGFVAGVRNRNPNSQYMEVPSGGHYDSMIQQGIPAGIVFLKKVLGV